MTSIEPGKTRARKSSSVILVLSVIFAWAMMGFPGHAQTVIHYPDGQPPQVKTAAEVLAEDIRRAYPDQSVVLQVAEAGNWPEGKAAADATRFFLAIHGNEHPAANVPDTLPTETFVIQRAGKSRDVYITGADVRGLFYGVYDYAEKELGIDSFAFWTGREPETRTGPVILPDGTRQAEAPTFKLRGYFDNDNDQLANFSGRKLIVEFELWQEMIDSLARLRYNYVDLHDALGRPEFYQRAYYKRMVNFQTDVELVDRIIDYAHSRGMMVQVPLTLGWQFYHMDLERTCLSKSMGHWLETIDYYLKETPLSKADLFSIRPRHPYLDHSYKCYEELEKGITPGPLFTEYFARVDEMLKRHNPESILFTDTWGDAWDMWVEGVYAPPKGTHIMWSDHGVADFPEWPTEKKGFPFGIYLHAGVWHNNVMQDPYPARIKEAALGAKTHGMTDVYFVNGQTFKPFILNIEAAAKTAWNPDSFDPDAFYQSWAGRYFGADASAGTVASLKALHEAHDAFNGFRYIMKSTVQQLKWIRNGNRKNRFDAVPARAALAHAERSLALALEAAEKVPQDRRQVYDDQILFPARLFVANLSLLNATSAWRQADLEGDSTGREGALTLERLKHLHALLRQGSGWEKWDGWYLPENFRIHTPPPSIADVEALVASIPAPE